MISPVTNKHQKHAPLARASYGEWGRNELAILGTTCDVIRTLAHYIIQSLPSYKIAYADADHTSANAASAGVSAFSEHAFIEYSDKISYTQLNIFSQINTFQKRAMLNDCDLILVNGNHFTATRQIVVIDERKSLEKKRDKLTNVQLVLVNDSSAIIPGYLRQILPDIDKLPRFTIEDKEAIIRHIKTYLHEQRPAINGLVLSGGKSTRMGRDKGDIHYHEKSQREYVFAMLSSYCEATFVSCNAEQSRHLPNMPKIEDAFLQLGPLGGILSAFQKEPGKAWLTIACDLPFLTEETIHYLISHRNPSKMATAFLDSDGEFPEPLVTIWEPKAYFVLLQFLSQGYSCPRKALINSDIELLHAPDALAFKNINTGEEYAEALTLLYKQL